MRLNNTYTSKLDLFFLPKHTCKECVFWNFFWKEQYLYFSQFKQLIYSVTSPHWQIHLCLFLGLICTICCFTFTKCELKMTLCDVTEGADISQWDSTPPAQAHFYYGPLLRTACAFVDFKPFGGNLLCNTVPLVCSKNKDLKMLDLGNKYIMSHYTGN